MEKNVSRLEFFEPAEKWGSNPHKFELGQVDPFLTKEIFFCAFVCSFLSTTLPFSSFMASLDGGRGSENKGE